MPIIRFKCNDCSKEFAKIFFSPLDAPRACPVCAGDRLEELGPAFYVDSDRFRRSLNMGCDDCGSCESGTCHSVPLSS